MSKGRLSPSTDLKLSSQPHGTVNNLNIKLPKFDCVHFSSEFFASFREKKLNRFGLTPENSKGLTWFFVL